MSLERGYEQQLSINSNHIDSSVNEFTTAFLDSSVDQEIITLVSTNRRDIPPIHFGLLIYASYQFALLDTQNQSDLSDISWHEAISHINKHNLDLLEESILEKHVSITSPGRYSALAIATKSLFDNPQDLVVLDAGCGYYPMGIGHSLEEYLPYALDQESNNLVESMNGNGFPYKKALAVDIQKPEPAWAAACTWQPLDQLHDTFSKFSEAKNNVSSSVEFQQLDLIEKPPNVSENVDVVFLANVLYQLSDQQKEKFLSNINKVIAEDGIILTADYLPGGSRKREFTYAVQSKVLVNGDISPGQNLFYLDTASCSQIRTADQH